MLFEDVLHLIVFDFFGLQHFSYLLYHLILLQNSFAIILTLAKMLNSLYKTVRKKLEVKKSYSC